MESGNMPEVRVLRSAAPLKVAQAVYQEVFRDAEGLPLLWQWRGDYYFWEGERWEKKDQWWLERVVAMVLADAVVKVELENGGEVEKSYDPTMEKVKGVCYFLGGAMELEGKMPLWTDGQGGDPNYCVAFEDVVVDVRRSAEETKRSGKFTVVRYERGPEFLTNCVLRVPYDEEAKCPTWERCMGEWGGKDDAWTELRERAYGYALQTQRSHKKWVYEYGESYGGKSTGTRDVLGVLMGRPSYFSTMADMLVGSFGLDGLQSARVMVVTEVDGGVGRVAMSKLESLVKVLCADEETTVNVKGLRQLQGLRLGVLPILQGNKMLEFTDAKEGMTKKMLPIYFGKSFDGARGDAKLHEKLALEMTGIAKRLVHAAIRLEVDGEWPMPETSRGLLMDVRLMANPWDAFLEWGFVKSETGFVAKELIRKMKGEYERQSQRYFRTKAGKMLNEQNFTAMLMKYGTWRLTERKRGVGERELNVLQGLSVRSGERRALPDI